MPLFHKKKQEQKDKPKVAESKPVAKKEDKPVKDLYIEENKTKNQTAKTEKKNVSAGRILVKPLITEKASDLGALNKYVFAVSLNSNKLEIAKAIEDVYGMKPKDVNIVRMAGKKVRRGRITGKKKDWKKAIVTLPAGKSIQIYEGV